MSHTKYERGEKKKKHKRKDACARERGGTCEETVTEEAWVREAATGDVFLRTQRQKDTQTPARDPCSPFTSNEGAVQVVRVCWSTGVPGRVCTRCGWYGASS